MLDPGTQLRQMVTSVAHTLRANDPGKWKGVANLLATERVVAMLSVREA
jgi:hypothetical protein